MAQKKRAKIGKSVSEIMASIGSSDTKPELAARQWLWTHGYRYRKNDRTLPGTPDIVVSAARVAIFIHGCFWHRHEGCSMATMPKSNVEFWQAKFSRNVTRDQRVREQLRQLGWRTMVIWECQLKKDKVEETMALAAHLLDQAREEWELQRSTRRPMQIRQYDQDDDDNMLLAAEPEEY